MAGCELNMAHAFVAAPAAHRMRHDVIVTSGDDYDGSGRRRCVENDDESEADRDTMIPQYRLVPSPFGHGGGGEWVTLSKSVLLQLVERICQLSFQTENLAATAATATCPSSSPPSDRLETSEEILMDVVQSTNTHSTATEAERPGRLSPTSNDAAATASASGYDVEISNIDNTAELTAKGQGNGDGVPTSDKEAAGDTNVIPSQEIDVDEAEQDAHCDDDYGEDSEVFTSLVPMQEGVKAEDASSLTETAPSMSTSLDIAVPDVCVVPLAGTRKPPTPTASLRSAHMLRTDRRRRLRELRRLRRHHQAVVTADDQSHDCCRDRRRAVIVRRRFAVPHQPPPRFQDRQIADVENRSDQTTTDEASPMRLPAGCRYGRVCQPWSALNKVVVCQLVDVVLSQELTPTTTTWRSATASVEKRRSSGTIWNPAITPETRECRSPQAPQAVNSLSSVVSPSSADRGSSTLLQSLLSPMAAAAAATTTYVDRRRMDTTAVDVEVGGDSLAWTMSQSLSGRRRHHSAAAPDSFHVPWTSPPPSFFWYNVPPSQGNFLLLPDAGSRPCYRWIAATQPATLSPTSAAAEADVSALDYRVQTLDAGGCPGAVDTHRQTAATVSADPGLPRGRGSRPSTPPAFVSGRRVSGEQLKWVVVNKTDVCSLFESLASSMVVDSGVKRTSEEWMTDSEKPSTDPGSRAVYTGAEPMKWKSTLLRRARAEAQTPKRARSKGDVPENTPVSFH